MGLHSTMSSELLSQMEYQGDRFGTHVHLVKRQYVFRRATRQRGSDARCVLHWCAV